MATSTLSFGRLVVDPVHADLAQSLLSVRDALADHAKGKGRAHTSQIDPEEDITDEEYAIKMQENNLQDVLRTMEDYRLAKSLAEEEEDTGAAEPYDIVNQEAIDYLKVLIPDSGNGMQNGVFHLPESTRGFNLILNTTHEGTSVRIETAPDTVDDEQPLTPQEEDDDNEPDMSFMQTPSAAAAHREAVLDIFYSTGQAAPSNVASKRQTIDLTDESDDEDDGADESRMLDWSDGSSVRKRRIDDDGPMGWSDGSSVRKQRIDDGPTDWSEGSLVQQQGAAVEDEDWLNDSIAHIEDVGAPSGGDNGKAVDRGQDPNFHTLKDGQPVKSDNNRAASPPPNIVNILGDQFGYPTVYCMICGDLVVGEPTLRASCGHDICVDCVQDLVSSATRDESLYPPQCCRQPLTQEAMGPFLTVKLQSDFDAKRAEFDVPAELRVFCPRETCSAFIGSSEAARLTIACPTCALIICVSCKQGHHPGESCAENSLTASVKKLAEENRWQTCPKCKAIVEKTVGCDHITCRCSFNFCYRCGKAMGQCGGH